MKKLISLIVMVLVLASVCFATSYQWVQGTTDKAGDVQVYVCTAQSLGSCFHNETFTSRAVGNRFAVKLGESVAYNPSYGQNYYLSVEINGTVLIWNSTGNRWGQFTSTAGNVSPAYITGGSFIKNMSFEQNLTGDRVGILIDNTAPTTTGNSAQIAFNTWSGESYTAPGGRIYLNNTDGLTGENSFTFQTKNSSGGLNNDIILTSLGLGIGKVADASRLNIDSKGNTNHVVRIDALDSRGSGRYALYIDDNDANSRGSVYVDTTSGNAITIIQNGNSGTGTTDASLSITNTNNNNRAIDVYSNEDNASSSELVFLYADNVLFDEEVLNVRNDGTGYTALFDINGIYGSNGVGVYILNDFVAQTSGQGLLRVRNAVAGSTDEVVQIANDGRGDGLLIDANNGTGLYVDWDGTTGYSAVFDGGNVVIGTTSTTSRLQTFADDRTRPFMSQGQNYAYIYNNETALGGDFSTGLYIQANSQLTNSSGALKILGFGTNVKLTSWYNGATEKGSIDSEGDLQIDGSITKGSGTFRIDNPENPTEEYLFHQFYESPEALLSYRGIAETTAGKTGGYDNGHGWYYYYTAGLSNSVVVTLPSWFNDLTRNGINWQEFTGQVTGYKSFCGDAYFDFDDIDNNKFTIVTEKPCQLSWHVQAVRHDAYYDSKPMDVVVEKDYEPYVPLVSEEIVETDDEIIYYETTEYNVNGHSKGTCMHESACSGVVDNIKNNVPAKVTKEIRREAKAVEEVEVQ